MRKSSISREKILNALREKLEPLAHVNAMWEGGAASFQRVDQWSDIDLQIDVAADRVADTFVVIEQALTKLSPIDLEYALPQPTWHGHAQTFYRLKHASPYLLLDVCVIKDSNPNKFLQPEIHNPPVVHFDKCNVVHWQPLDHKALVSKLKERLETLRVTFNLFQILTTKESYRHNDIEALNFYHGFTLRPLVEVLRIKYAPTRYNFHTRYIHYDLPKPIVRKLENLFFVKDHKDLVAKRKKAERFFYATLEEIDLKKVEMFLHNNSTATKKKVR